MMVQIFQANMPFTDYVVIVFGRSQVKKKRNQLERKAMITFITIYFVDARLFPGKSLFQRSRTHTSAVKSTFLDYKLCKASCNSH